MGESTTGLLRRPPSGWKRKVGYDEPNATKFVNYIRRKYKLPPAKDDNKIRPDLPKDQVPLVKAAAGRKVAQAKRAAPAVSKAVTAAVTANGGTLARTGTQLKGAESMERKIADDVVEKGSSAEVAAARIRDSLRYTAVLPTDGYWAAGTRIGDALKAAGYEQTRADTQGWGPNRNYMGRNEVFGFRGPDGVEFEVQFHTAESLHAAERNHDLYNLARRADTPQEAKDELNAAQRYYNRTTITMPNDLPSSN